jgi:hypothetical protein
MTEITVLQKSYEAVLDQKQALLKRVGEQQLLIDELVPYLLNEIRIGLSIGPFLDCPEPDCEDCNWYADCVAWKARIDAGELGAYRL